MLYGITLLTGACLLALSANISSIDKPQVIILLGAPGAGKGSQALRLSKELKLPHIATGDLYRENMRNDTPLGQEAKKFVNAGKLAPDSLTMDMLVDRIKHKDCSKGYILDGFPRTQVQAKLLENYLGNTSQITVINLNVPDSIILDRITGRLMCPQCGASYHKTNKPPKQTNTCDNCQNLLTQRKDDSAEIVQHRLHVYHTNTKPLENYYQEQKQLITINGEQPFDSVFKDLIDALKQRD